MEKPVAEQRVQRRLAAILAADVVGRDWLSLMKMAHAHVFETSIPN